MSRRGWRVAFAGTLAALATTSGLVAATGQPSQKPPPKTIPFAVPGFEHYVAPPSAQAAMRTLTALLAEAPKPPHATRVLDSSLTPPPGGISFAPTSHMVRIRQEWIAPGGVGKAYEYILRRPPGLLRASNQGITLEGGYALHMTSLPSDEYTPELDYQINPRRGDSVVIHIDAWAVWVAPRPTWSFVAGNRSTLNVRFSRTSRSVAAVNVKRTFTGSGANRLAQRLDAVRPRSPIDEGSSCPAFDAAVTVLIRAHTPSGDIRFKGGLSCGLNSVISSSAHPGELSYIDGRELTIAVIEALGLPASYANLW